jgi:hypothetical protein
MRLLEPFWGLTKNTSSPTQSFWFFPTSYLPQSFSLLPTSLPHTSPLLRTSPDFVLTPSPELGSSWNGSHNKALEAGRQTPSSKLKSVSSETLKWDPKQEFQGKLPPLSPSLFGFVTTKKATIVVHVAFFWFHFAVAKKMMLLSPSFFGFVAIKKAMAPSCCHLLLFWFCCNKKSNISCCRCLLLFRLC